MLGLPKVIAKFNPIQVSVMKFIKIVQPYYNQLAKRFRFRCNYRELKTSDVVIIACMLARIDLREVSESQFHRNLIASGIRVPERTRYNRRCRQLTMALKLIRIWMLKRYRHESVYEIIDSAPITLVSARRSNRAKVLKGIANKGYNATKRVYYYGFKLHAVMSNDGYFIDWELTPASVDDRKVTIELLREAPAKYVLADGGYLSRPQQQFLRQEFGIHLWFPLRKNMRHSKQVNSAFLKNQRRHIETCFSNLNKVGHFEHPETDTMSGLNSRLSTLFLWNVIKVHHQLEQGLSGLKIN
ncbi:IS982 family transposase [Levilactobacillus brevis]|nr:IS982 family transposase [Levilactobacillus brevis]AYM02093.1 IS982 family transposase [Levilactobacillus brevis]AYM02625.1 IS982 family transposase [Levilactobacillus brevis]AYM02837.1 IS982 family transposase [Levilactobacillus brevis]